MDLEEKKESLVQQYNDLTKQIQELTELRLKILGAVELIEQIEEENENEVRGS